MAAQPLTTQQQALIQALVVHTGVISEAALQVGIQPKEALAWMQKPYMRQAFEQARQELVGRLIEEARAGKCEGAMMGAALARSDEPTAMATSLQAIADFTELQASTEGRALLQERIGQYISELSAYLSIPMEQLLVWK